MSSRGSRGSHDKRRMKRRLYGDRKVMPCCFCRRPLSFDVATLEHVIPLSAGGGYERENLRLSCSTCNSERGTIEFETFRTMKRDAIRSSQASVKKNE